MNVDKNDRLDHAGRAFPGGSDSRCKAFSHAKAPEGEKGPGAFTAFGLKAEAEPIRPGLHVVATPIGNLGDISFRALATLAAADAIVAFGIDPTDSSTGYVAHDVGIDGGAAFGALLYR